MPFALNFYHDQIDASGATTAPLPAAQRLLYVRHGQVLVNGQQMGADAACYCDRAVELKSTGDWSQIWRWELALPNEAPLLHAGAGVLSRLRMARVICNLAMLTGTRWLLRLDRITTAPGRIADRHQHPGPGIRCLVEGTFNVQAGRGIGARSWPRRCLVGDRNRHCDRLGIPPDGRQVHARHGAAG